MKHATGFSRIVVLDLPDGRVVTDGVWVVRAPHQIVDALLGTFGDILQGDGVYAYVMGEDGNPAPVRLAVNPKLGAQIAQWLGEGGEAPLLELTDRSYQTGEFLEFAGETFAKTARRLDGPAGPVFLAEDVLGLVTVHAPERFEYAGDGGPGDMVHVRRDGQTVGIIMPYDMPDRLVRAQEVLN